MRKGITPIVSIIILLLITVSIAGSAWTFISGYWGSLIGKTIQAMPVSPKSSSIIVENTGTSPINANEVIVMVNDMPSIVMNPQRIESGSSEIINFMPATLIDPVNDRWELGPFGPGIEVSVNGPSNFLSYTVDLDIASIPNLLRNGDFEQGTTAGWGISPPVGSNFTVYTAERHGGSYAGRVIGSSYLVYSSDYIPYNLNETFHLELYAKSVGSGGLSRLYAGFLECDKDKYSIAPYHVYYFENTKTTLAAPLSPGQTTVSLSNGTNWRNASSPSFQRAIGFWNTGDYPDYTYTRTTSWFNDTSGNTVTLSGPWSGPAIPAGTSVANMFSGSSYNYVAASYALVPNNWTYYSGRSGWEGWKYGETVTEKKFRYGTEYLQIDMLVNFQQNSSYTTLIDDLRVWVGD